MLIAEVTIYGKGGDPVWCRKKIVSDVLEGLDYLSAIQSAIWLAYVAREGHMIDQHLHDPERAAANGSA